MHVFPLYFLHLALLIPFIRMVGHETTSCTVSFTLLELARHPVVQQKLRQEIRDLSDFSYDHIQSLPYLDAVCREGCVK